MTQLTDEDRMRRELEIIKTVLAGDREAFRYFVDSYGPMVHALIMRQVHDQVLAKDLFQDVFVRAFRSLATFKAQAKFGTWIARIAINVCHSYFESRTYKSQQASEELSTELAQAVAGSSDDEQPFSETDIETLRECLGKLKSHYREAVVLCLLEQKSYREASEILEIPSGTIGSRLSKALVLLKDCFFGTSRISKRRRT